MAEWLAGASWDVVADPDLSPGVFWLLGADGLPAVICAELTGVLIR
jgi:hypothetical protein